MIAPTPTAAANRLFQCFCRNISLEFLGVKLEGQLCVGCRNQRGGSVNSAVDHPSIVKLQPKMRAMTRGRRTHCGRARDAGEVLEFNFAAWLGGNDDLVKARPNKKLEQHLGMLGGGSHAPSIHCVRTDFDRRSIQTNLRQFNLVVLRLSETDRFLSETIRHNRHFATVPLILVGLSLEATSDRERVGSWVLERVMIVFYGEPHASPLRADDNEIHNIARLITHSFHAQNRSTSSIRDPIDDGARCFNESRANMRRSGIPVHTIPPLPAGGSAQRSSTTIVQYTNDLILQRSPV